MLFARVLSAQPGDVAIQFVSPEKFADFRIYGLDVTWWASFFARQISDDIKPTLNEKFPGSKLTLRFTNINLAYNYRTFGRSGLGVRVVRRPIGPERMWVAFLLQDSGGRIVASGWARNIDTSTHNILEHPPRGAQLSYYAE